MPLSLEPNQRFEIVLDSDKEKPVESRPVFFAKSQSMRGQKKILDVLDKLTADASIEELFSDAVEAIASSVSGWKNMAGIEYSPEALRELLSYQEARELLRKVAYNQHMDTEEKKS